MALFTDGEPLNIDNLNKLESRLNQLEAKLITFTSKYEDSSGNSITKMPVIETGSFDATQGKGTKDYPITLTRFTVDEDPILLASPRGNLETNQQISISTTPRSRNPKVFITSSVALKNQAIDWVAIVLR